LEAIQDGKRLGRHPVAELDELHQQVVTDTSGTSVAVGEEIHVGTANATDAVISFVLPKLSAGQSCTFGFATQGLVSHDGSGGNYSVLQDGFIVAINYTLPNSSETASGINYVDTSVAITAKPAPPPPAPGGGFHQMDSGSHRTTVPVHRRGHPPPPPPAPVPLLGMLTNETEVTLRVFTDGPGKSIEIYYMGGRKVCVATALSCELDGSPIYAAAAHDH
jgi:hypothetical protein